MLKKVLKIIGYIFFLSSLLAGLSGAFICLDTGIEPTFGFRWLLKGVIVSIISGFNFYGLIIGSFVLSLIENIVVYELSAIWKDVIAFMVLIIFLFLKKNEQKRI